MPEEQRTIEARKKALALLEIRDRTTKELRERLLRCGYSREEAEDALRYAASLGYVDDLRYAENYILWRKDEKSQKKIFTDLYTKGISRETMEQAWEEAAGDDHEESSMIEKEILKKYPAGSSLTPKQMRSLQGSLARKGFRYEDITDALSRCEISVEW